MKHKASFALTALAVGIAVATNAAPLIAGSTAIAATPAETCDQLWDAFMAADALRQQEQGKPGITAAYRAATLGGERIGRQILAQECPLKDRAKFEAALNSLHLLGQMMVGGAANSTSAEVPAISFAPPAPDPGVKTIDEALKDPRATGSDFDRVIAARCLALYHLVGVWNPSLITDDYLLSRQSAAEEVAFNTPYKDEAWDESIDIQMAVDNANSYIQRPDLIKPDFAACDKRLAAGIAKFHH